MFWKIVWLMVAWFAAKELVPTMATIVSELVYYAAFRSHSPAFIKCKERSLDLREREQELNKRQAEERRKAERLTKGPIGFKSDDIRS